jgi:hypothetical protein
MTKNISIADLSFQLMGDGHAIAKMHMAPGAPTQGCP